MKNLFFLLGALLVSSPLFSQVKFNLGYQPETGVYTVSILPEISWAAPKNTVGSAQIVLRASADLAFTPNIISLIPGTTWIDNAYVEKPAAAPAFTFVCIALASGPTDKITLAEGHEIPLFSFTNAGGGCAGLVELVENDDPVVQAVKTGGFNVTQNFSVLGARGNAFTGIANGSVECAVSGSKDLPDKFIESVQISPVPSSEDVMIRWHLLADYNEHLDLVITNSIGQEVFREKVTGSKGEGALKVIVKDWKSGIYRVNFQFSRGRRTQAWNLMVMH